MSPLAAYEALSADTGIALPPLLRAFLASGHTVYGPDWAATWRQRCLQDPPLLTSLGDFEWLSAQDSREVVQQWLNPQAQGGRRFLPFAQTGAGDAWCLTPWGEGAVGVALVLHDAAHSRVLHRTFDDFVQAGVLAACAELGQGLPDFSDAELLQSLQADVARVTAAMEAGPAAALQALCRRPLALREFRDGPRARPRQVRALLSQDELAVALAALPAVDLAFPVVARWELEPAAPPVAAPVDWRVYAADPQQKMAALRAYREHHGASLAEAKAAVDRYLAERQAPGGQALRQ